MPRRERYIKDKNAKIEQFKNDLNISVTDAELLYSLIREGKDQNIKPIIKYRLKRFAFTKHIRIKHIEKLYRTYLEHKAKELQRPIITALLIRRSNKDNLIMQECQLIDTEESYKSLLNIDASIQKEQARIKNININFYYDKLTNNKDLTNTKNLVLIERYGGYFKDRVIITKRDKKTGKNITLNYEDITIILNAKKRQIINNKIIDVLIANE